MPEQGDPLDELRERVRATQAAAARGSGRSRPARARGARAGAWPRRRPVRRRAGARARRAPPGEPGDARGLMDVVRGAVVRLTRAWRALASEQRLATIAALALL